MMPSILLWLPLVLNMVAWVMFFFFWRQFNAQHFLHRREAHRQQLLQLEKITGLLQRATNALEK